MAKKIAIVGAGSMATACAMVLAQQQHEIWMLARTVEKANLIDVNRENKTYLPGAMLPDCIHVSADPCKVLSGCDLVFSSVPTQFIRETWGNLVPYLEDVVSVCSLAKGIEVNTLLSPTQVLAQVIAETMPGRSSELNCTLSALSGPAIAEELAKGLPATLVAASADSKSATLIQDAFAGSTMRVYTNDDLVGVELSGAAKNVIALASGICDGLSLGFNAKSALLARGLAEISRLGEGLNAKARTFAGVAGVGDLATTCFSPVGRNRTCGEWIGKGLTVQDAIAKVNGVVEGVATSKAMLRLAQSVEVEVPITQVVNQVLFEGVLPAEGIRHLMSRDLKSE